MGMCPIVSNRLSRLLCVILAWLDQEERRTSGTISTDHHALVLAMDVDKGNFSNFLKSSEHKGLSRVQRTPAGKAEAIDLTPAGRTQAEVVNKERICLCPR
jgi:DNA-binding MarR family transcriptional regulator